MRNKTGDNELQVVTAAGHARRTVTVAWPC